MGNREHEWMHQFDRLYNFRDIGGYQTQEGNFMKTGVIFRSDHLARISENDIKKLQQLNIRFICDLRTEREYQSKRARLPKNSDINLLNIPVQQFETQDANLKKLLKFLFANSGAEQYDVFIRDFYYQITFERTSQIKEILTLLSEEKNVPAIIHCAAGKDRTGIISALIQLLVGVPYDTVLEDYLLTNQYYEPRMHKVIKIMRWMTLFQAKPERMRHIFMARRNSLDEIHEEMIKKYGSVEQYLCEACNIDQKVTDRLKQLLLE